MAARSNDADDAAWTTLARLVKTQGRRGELAADILTDIPGRFDELQQVALRASTGTRQVFPLASHWFHKGRVVLHFSGIEDMTAAEAWIGAEVQAPRAERPAPPAGSYYLADLVGCEVFDQQQSIGRVTEVEAVGGAAPLLHVRPDAGAADDDALVPFVAAYLESVSIPEAKIVMRLPEGLVELNRR